jgi:hypothetical protein
MPDRGGGKPSSPATIGDVRDWTPGRLQPNRDASGLSFNDFAAAVPKGRLDEIARVLGHDLRVTIVRWLWQFRIDRDYQADRRKRLARASKLAARLADEADAIARMDDPDIVEALEDFAKFREIPEALTQSLRPSGMRWLNILDEYAWRTAALLRAPVGAPSFRPFDRLLGGMTEVFVGATSRQPIISGKLDQQYELFVRLATVELLASLATRLEWSAARAFPAAGEKFRRRLRAVAKAYCDRQAPSAEKAP